MSETKEFDKIKSLMSVDNLIFGIGQVSELLGVSTRQLRYWEQQGYIESLESPKGSSRQFNLKNLIKIFHIKHFQNEGYTLQAAVKKGQKIEKQFPILKDFLRNKVEDIIPTEDGGKVDFGFLDDDKTKHIYGVVDKDGYHFKIVKEK